MPRSFQKGRSQLTHRPPASEQADPKAIADSGETESEKARGDSGEVGGPKGPEPTRYGDWEKNGRCIDF
jgi:hypothetical protein